jgi:hypothetical protein
MDISATTLNKQATKGVLVGALRWPSLSQNPDRQYNAKVMSAIQAKIAQILDGFREGHAQYEETVRLLDSYFETLPTQARGEFQQQR